MQLVRLLHNLFKKELPFVHKARLQNVFHACDTAIKNNKLYLTGLGRGLSNKNKTSSNIQKIDRLLGNCPLQEEQNDFYKVMISYLIQENSTPWIHVDWACINSLTNRLLLDSLSVWELSHTFFARATAKPNY